ncbi:DUF1876 domain-containing protein [Dactylosporangium sp. AC04546]|uniref:DUF1876 domain-containing protein n=1 Tax=Dactylosporangium sp. AC04546 TaxID=2862460 RepID=UPI001EE03C59|nr:DUF1876 domain-containing protein [Dactylosporangium sp. AC04546]WVK78613.1 DUF1876 domain-containing protein [Dactylosporangium sp. AC04546]
MTEVKRWTVSVFVGEHDGRTYAEARLHAGDKPRLTQLAGTGLARLNPVDTDIPAIGDELAVARALSELGHQLLLAAASDIRATAGRPVHLRR